MRSYELPKTDTGGLMFCWSQPNLPAGRQWTTTTTTWKPLVVELTHSQLRLWVSSQLWKRSLKWSCACVRVSGVVFEPSCEMAARREATHPSPGHRVRWNRSRRVGRRRQRDGQRGRTRRRWTYGLVDDERTWRDRRLRGSGQRCLPCVAGSSAACFDGSRGRCRRSVPLPRVRKNLT